MNQNMTPQRPPQNNAQRSQGAPQSAPQRPQGAPRRPQGAPQRQPGRPPQRPPQRKKSPYGAILVISLIVTVSLLVVSLIVLCVALAVGGNNEEPERNDNDYVQNDRPQQGNQNQSTTKKDGVVTNPSRSNYNIANSSSYQTIGGITSEYAVLMELDSFQTVAGINEDERICPASMTKVMTVLIACENLNSLNDKVTVTQDAVNYQADHRASGYGLEAGEVVSVKDLLYLIYYRSDTVSCLMMADYIAGSESDFVKLMNDKVSAMGLKNTHFSNSTGLYFEGDSYYTTCREMAAIMAYALENSLAKQILTSTGQYYLSTSKHSGEAIGPGWRVDAGRLGSTQPDGTNVTVKAGKTGYETISGSCLVTYSTSGGKQYIQVIVGGENVSNATCTRDVKHIYNTYAN